MFHHELWVSEKWYFETEKTWRQNHISDPSYIVQVH